MCDYTLRRFRPGDEAALRRVWKAGFDDTDEYIDTFFDAFAGPDSCVLAEADGIVVSAMYLLDGPVLFPYRRNRLTSAYAYALATLNEYRGRGIGSAVYRGVCALGFERGFDAVCVLPAGEGLYPFYEAGGGARIVSSVRETEYSAQELRGAGRLPCARIPVEEYAGIRESLLQGEAHGAMPESFYRWQDSLCGRYGGGLFVLDGGVAAAEMDGGVCHIRELLVPGGDEKAAAAALASFCRAERYVVRAPAFWDGPGAVRRHMLARLREEPAFYLPDDLWWGFAFD